MRYVRSTMIHPFAQRDTAREIFSVHPRLPWTGSRSGAGLRLFGDRVRPGRQREQEVHLRDERLVVLQEQIFVGCPRIEWAVEWIRQRVRRIALRLGMTSDARRALEAFLDECIG